MAKKDAEERAQNLKLAEKCQDQVSKIKASSSRGGAAPMSASPKAAKDQQPQEGGPKKPHRYQPGT